MVYEYFADDGGSATCHTAELQPIRGRFDQRIILRPKCIIRSLMETYALVGSESRFI